MGLQSALTASQAFAVSNQEKFFNSLEFSDSCLVQMTVLIMQGLSFAVSPTLLFSDEIKDSGTLLCRKAGKATQTHSFNKMQNTSGYLTYDIYLKTMKNKY